jgi:hypothetical protein
MIKMENVIPTTTKKREQFKVIPVLERTRERLKNDMMKVDTYDSYINKKLDKIVELEKQLAATKVL